MRAYPSHDFLQRLIINRSARIRPGNGPLQRKDSLVAFNLLFVEREADSVMIRLRHNLQWLVRGQRGHGRSENRLALATAITIIVSYLTVVLACACIEGKYLGFSGSQHGAYEYVTQVIPAHDADEELCGFTRAQILTLQTSSAVSVLTVKALF